MINFIIYIVSTLMHKFWVFFHMSKFVLLLINLKIQYIFGKQKISKLFKRNKLIHCGLLDIFFIFYIKKQKYILLELCSQQNGNMLAQVLLRTHSPRFITLLVRLLWRGAVHDISKLRWSEIQGFSPYIRKLGKVKYGTPEYTKMIDNIRPVISLHYKRNSHHPEYWKMGIQGMDLVYLLEMYCDWKASGRRSPGGNIQDSIMKQKEKLGLDVVMTSILINT
jgi:hypothetical protein